MAVEQGGAHGAFKIGEALAHGRGGHEFLLGRLADAAALAHRHKELERGEVEAAVGGFHGCPAVNGDESPFFSSCPEVDLRIRGWGPPPNKTPPMAGFVWG